MVEHMSGIVYPPHKICNIEKFGDDKKPWLSPSWDWFYVKSLNVFLYVQ